MGNWMIGNVGLANWILMAYVDKVLKTWKGWTYHQKSVILITLADGNNGLVWWITVINLSGAVFRGTGVLIRQADEWKIAHYALVHFLVAHESLVASVSNKR